MITTRQEALQELARLRALVTGALWGRLPEASADFDRTRLDVQIFEEVLRVRKLLLRSVMAALRPKTEQVVTAARAATPPAAGSVGRKRGRGRAAEPTRNEEDPAVRVLEGLQLFVLQHPVAAQKLFASLVAEGRRYADTEEGARWARVLGGSPVVRRARQLWESSLASVLDDSGDTILPSEYVEILLQGAKLVAPEELGARISDKLSTAAARR